VTKTKKNPAAVALGRLGGSAKTTKPKGFAAITKKRLKEIIADRDRRKKEAQLR
jgi:hypothetical protein